MAANAARKSKSNTESYLRMYRQMVRIRAFEDNANQLYLSAKMPGLTHMYSGQEAVAVNARHQDCLRRSEGAINAALEQLRKGLSPELAAVDLRIGNQKDWISEFMAIVYSAVNQHIINMDCKGLIDAVCFILSRCGSCFIIASK